MGASAAAGPPFDDTGLGGVAVVARISDNGVPDPTFAGSGFLALPIPGFTAGYDHATAIDGRGRIVMGILTATTASFPRDVTAKIVRVTADGALDATFGSGGQVLLGRIENAPAISVTGTGDILAVGGWSYQIRGQAVMAARFHPSGQLDATFGSGGEVSADLISLPTASVLDCEGDLVVSGHDGVRRFGPDGRLDPTFHGPGVPRVPVGATSAVPGFGSLAVTPSGAIVLVGGASDGPSILGGSSQVGNASIAVARLTATCPVVDTRPPTVTLTCTAGCRRVAGAVLDDPVGRGVRRVLLGVEQITGRQCKAWNGRRFTALPCRRASSRLVAVPVKRGTFRTPLLGSGSFVVRAVAIDRAGNRSRVVVRRVPVGAQASFAQP